MTCKCFVTSDRRLPPGLDGGSRRVRRSSASLSESFPDQCCSDIDLLDVDRAACDAPAPRVAEFLLDSLRLPQLIFRVLATP